MASTFTPQDAINMARALAHKTPSSTMEIYACQMIHAWVWTAFPWTWTRSTLTQISLTDGVQDYALGGSDLTTFYRFVNLELQNTSVSPILSRWLSQKSHLSVELQQKGGTETIRLFSWEPPLSKLRLDYAAAVPSGTTLVLNGEYQIKPVVITGATLNTVFTAPDHYFQVFVEGLRWKFYELTDDARAGNTQFVKQRAIHTGQKATFMDAFEAMKEAEDFSDGEDSLYPGGGSLAVGRENYVPRIYG